ncbi:MAG: hypothetical protein CMI96_03170 [Pelagibacteraceae bacterium]|nr:hypothetical protein [Pelagibacteraceae bacterium]
MSIKKLREIMDYRNFKLRSLSSLLFLLLYFLIISINLNLIVVLVSFIYFLIILEIYFYFKIIFKLIYIYIFLSIISFYIYFYSYFNLYEFNLVILTIITFDIFSYYVGSLYGKNKLYFKISPNKTYEGLFGGIFFSNLLSLIYTFIFFKGQLFQYIILINIVISLSFFGDLIESYFKRINQIKNSSNYIPGHGGFFDRFDSFIFAIIFIVIFKIVNIL